MGNNILIYLMGGAGALFVLVLIAYFILHQIMSKNGDLKKIKQLQQGTKEQKFSSQILSQKLYLIYRKIPGINRYLKKLRRRLEIINLEDEYLIRTQAAKILTKSLIIILPITLLIILLTKSDIMLLLILLIFEIFIIETLMSGAVDKIDNKILKQQIDFFAEIRHAYHEYNMVEEAIYAVSQNDELEISRQGDRIYEILVSDEPEEELEKYYDIAPNSYLKEFAGLSYLTKEFGDRTVDGGSLYLKNLNNITQEMQIEILKREKLDYVFQSLSFIAAAPILLIDPIKNWAVSQFSFTSTFYEGKGGLIVQVLLVIITFICYMLIRKIKDNGSNVTGGQEENPWQSKIYSSALGNKIINLLIPKKNTKEERKINKLMKDAASKSKIEWIYVNRVVTCVAAFFVVFFLFIQMHNMAINYVYTQPSADFNIVGQMSAADVIKAMEITNDDNIYLDKYRGNTDVTQDMIVKEIKNSSFYKGATADAVTAAAARIYGKLQTINKEYFQWFELLIAFALAIVAYQGPIWMLYFQKRMRQMAMEDEVMQFQTIIMMLMKIERINVEMILEWLERYANIFKSPITKCVNNYESGAWEALEELKNDTTYQPFIRLVESLQAAVERIPIVEAFDELDTERAYYQEKRKDANERLISKQGLIGRGIGFAPMIILFVGYLIIPLVLIGIMSTMQSFSSMQSMTGGATVQSVTSLQGAP
ncbi:MAG: hypothetical protein FWF46_00240 [Oscillospiraceae bacterium]|nr:hypothetical protein [Oscillospiraceae bacterium]